MNTLALEVEQTLQGLNRETAVRLERLVRDALELARPVATILPPQAEREEWLQRLDQLRASVGTGKQGPATEEILDDLRSEYDQ